MPMPTALIAGIDISACARRPSSLRSHCTWLPRPTGTPVAITSKAPPSVSPASRAAIDCAIIRASASRVDAAERRIGGDRLRPRANDTRAAVGDAPPGRCANTWLRDLDAELRRAAGAPARRRRRARRSRARWRARGCRACRRARTSEAPARSAWPGRGRVTAARRAPVASGGGSGPTCMVFCQLVQSRFLISERDRSAERLPLADARQHLGACPTRSPCGGLGHSRPGGARGRRRSPSGSTARPAGSPSTMTTSAWPCDSPAVRKRSIAGNCT